MFAESLVGGKGDAVNSRFYNTAAWRRLSKTFLCSKNYICERCGGPAEIAHHRTYLTDGNIMDPNISLNPAMLECLCQNCHNTEHFSAGGAVAKGLAFDEHGDLIKGVSYVYPSTSIQEGGNSK